MAAIFGIDPTSYMLARQVVYSASSVQDAGP